MGELRQVGLADADGAGLRNARHHDGIALWHEVGERDRAVAHPQAGYRDIVLDRDRHAVQRAQRVSPRDRRLGRLCLRACPLVERHREHVERRLKPLGARDHRVDHFDR